MNPYEQPTAAPRPWWKTTPAALGMLAAVTLLTLVSYGFGFLAAIAALAAVWKLPPWRWYTRTGASLAVLMMLSAAPVTGLGNGLADPDSSSPSATKKPDIPKDDTGNPVMPDVTGKRYQDAIETIKKTGVKTARITTESVYADLDAPKDPADWRVCFQAPGEGASLIIDYVTPDLKIINPGGTCPADPYDDLYDDPANNPDSPSYVDPDASGNSTSSGTSTGSSSVGDVTPGAWCETFGTIGIHNGHTYTCKGPGQKRWRR